MRIMAIDPGNKESAYVIWDGEKIDGAKKVSNEAIIRLLPLVVVDIVVFEQVACYGMPVGAETFETCLWIGRFVQAVHPRPVALVTRNEVKMALCHRTARVTDAVVRQRLLDIYGGKDKAIGRKSTPGPLYHVRSHLWAALALAVAVGVRPESEVVR